MNKDILRRLEKLESRQRSAYRPPAPVPLSLYLVGYFSDRFDAKASPAENYYRALGCENANEFHKLRTRREISAMITAVVGGV
jgi:hypothetical protein